VRAMSVDAIRQELDAFGADSAAIADGDKDKLVSELLNARAFSKPHFSPAEGAPSDAAQSPSGGGGTSSPPAPPAPPAPPPPAAADEEGLAEAAYAAALAEAMQMKVKELRGALAARNVGWADCLEKQELRGWGATSRLFSCSLTGTLSCLGAGCGAAGGALAPSSNLPGTLLGARGEAGGPGGRQRRLQRVGRPLSRPGWRGRRIEATAGQVRNCDLIPSGGRGDRRATTARDGGRPLAIAGIRVGGLGVAQAHTPVDDGDEC